MKNKELKNDNIFIPTHLTKQGFGRLLKEGVEVKILKSRFDLCTVQDSFGNVWHGNIKDLIKINMKPKNQNNQPKEPKEDENSPEFRGYVDRSEDSPMQDWAETSEDF